MFQAILVSANKLLLRFPPRCQTALREWSMQVIELKLFPAYLVTITDIWSVVGCIRHLEPTSHDDTDVSAMTGGTVHLQTRLTLLPKTTNYIYRQRPLRKSAQTNPPTKWTFSDPTKLHSNLPRPRQHHRGPQYLGSRICTTSFVVTRKRRRARGKISNVDAQVTSPRASGTFTPAPNVAVTT